MKTVQDISNQAYLNIEDIRKLLQVGYAQAKKYYKFADEWDNEELGRYRVEGRKVRITSLCKVTGFSLNTLKKQAESRGSGLL